MNYENERAERRMEEQPPKTKVDWTGEDYVPTTLEQLREVWDGWDVDVQDSVLKTPLWFDMDRNGVRFTFYVREKFWMADDDGDLLKITPKHMDMIDETGRILGWW